jgi:hypothetical protein
LYPMLFSGFSKSGHRVRLLCMMLSGASG